jgi:hypothetical protein
MCCGNGTLIVEMHSIGNPDYGMDETTGQITVLRGLDIHLYGAAFNLVRLRTLMRNTPEP